MSRGGRIYKSMPKFNINNVTAVAMRVALLDSSLAAAIKRCGFIEKVWGRGTIVSVSGMMRCMRVAEALCR